MGASVGPGRRNRYLPSVLRLLTLAFAALFLALAPAVAEPVRTENVEAELHSARAAIAPGERFTVVLRQNIRENWHTYWRNPGDSGEPTELSWRLPAGFEAGEIQWPAPEAIPFAILVNYGYSNEVLFPVAFTAPANAPIGQSVAFTADAYWLVCSDVCIPEEATLTLTLPVEAHGRDDPTWAPRIAEAVAALPQPASFEARITPGAPARLTIAAPDAEGEAHFFPYSRDVIDHAAPQQPIIAEEGIAFTLTQGIAENLGQVPLDGVIAYQAADGTRRAYEIVAQPGDPLFNAQPRPESETTLVGFLLLLLAAFIGGLILNIMPCVLPVLSIKALSFAGGAHSGEAKRHGVLYLVGVMATFLALAGLLIALRSAGEAVGWGFQLQAPWVTASLALLFFVIGLNLLSVFEIGGSLQNTGAGLATRRGDAGAFFTGALAVIAATPCTAPFMAGATGAALTQGPLATLTIFAALGLGFAAPLVALSFAPALQRAIPKPGPWMERAKNVLAFPMFGAAVWLAWVFVEQTGAYGALALLALTVALSFAIFVGRWGRAWLVVGLAALALTAAFTWRPIAGRAPVETLASEPWSAARVTALQTEGRGVFVNFTAAWCVTCKVNEGIAFTPRVAAAFADANVSYLKGDWTNRDADIAAALAQHGRAGVPLYLYYPPSGGAPVVLPQVLTEDIVISAISGETP